MPWNIEDYAKEVSVGNLGRNEEVEEKLIKMFPPHTINKYCVEPLVVLDNQNNVVAWYLPGIIRRSRQVGGKP